MLSFSIELTSWLNYGDLMFSNYVYYVDMKVCVFVAFALNHLTIVLLVMNGLVTFVMFLKCSVKHKNHGIFICHFNKLVMKKCCSS